jgi:hypothetical protein
VASSVNDAQLPIINELILVAIRKGIQDKLVAPRVTKFPLVWPEFWWPEVRTVRLCVPAHSSV